MGRAGGPVGQGGAHTRPGTPPRRLAQYLRRTGEPARVMSGRCTRGSGFSW
jgi:hypothetical protein